MFARTIIPLLLGVLLVAGCSSGSDEGGATSTATGVGDAQIGREEFGMTEAQLVNGIERTEAAIASCMADAGFEYIPIDAVTFRVAMDSLATAPGLSDEEFVAQFGYGISTLPPTRAFSTGEGNARIFEELSAADQVAYERALWGENTEATFVLMLENEDFTLAGGCTGTAVDEVFTEEQLDPSFVNPFDALVESDPRMVAANEEWATCMRDAGYDFANPDDGEESLLERLEAIAEGADPATLTGAAQQALNELQGEERALAAADIDCQERFLAPVEEQIERELTGRG